MLRPLGWFWFSGGGRVPVRRFDAPGGTDGPYAAPGATPARTAGGGLPARTASGGTPARTASGGTEGPFAAPGDGDD